MTRPLVRDWVHGFLDRYRVLHRTGDWPACDSQEWAVFARAWVTALSLKQVTEQEADHAAEALTLTPPQFREQHIREVIRVVEEIRAVNAPTAPAGSDRESAALASRDCQWCYGQGLAVVYHPHPDERRKVPPTCAAHCVCQLGRWMRGHTAPAELARIVDAANPKGYLFDPPGHVDLPDEGLSVAAMIRGMTRREPTGVAR